MAWLLGESDDRRPRAAGRSGAAVDETIERFADTPDAIGRNEITPCDELPDVGESVPPNRTIRAGERSDLRTAATVTLVLAMCEQAARVQHRRRRRRDGDARAGRG